MTRSGRTVSWETPCSGIDGTGVLARDGNPVVKWWTWILRARSFGLIDALVDLGEAFEKHPGSILGAEAADIVRKDRA
jgi:hypothetical protein